jgi:AraC-like DNA-binding protein
LLDGLEVKVETLDGGSGLNATLRQRPNRVVHLVLGGGGMIRITAGEIAVTPPRRRLRSAGDDPTSDARPVTRLDADAALACAHLRVTYRGGIGVFDHMDDAMVERLLADDPLRGSLEELWDEMVGRRPGSRAMVETLVRRYLLLLLRRCFGRRPSWLAAFEDARLGRALGAMQAWPEATFTLSTLAEEAGMSRSVFAARFTSVLGEPPMEFLKRYGSSVRPSC